ncbi:amidase family protein [Streptomyces sp. NPDC051976]|uniref:amidase n=1 Tax=Streptomyces sp. NPDC051976 TaxID=3154947 RepID=UPI0034482A42
MNANEICLMDATALAENIRDRKLSPVEVMDAFLEQTDRVNPAVNAYCAVLHERAREQAAEAERAVTSGQELGPLHGVPIGIKDITPTRGIEMSLGSWTFKGHVPDYDAVIVERSERAGAIQIGRTNSPEFAHSPFTNNLVYGPTHNPWNLAHTSGGSSGGSAAAVAAAMTPIAEGTDGGGSIRIPSSCCGTFGLKPQFGRIPSGILETHWESLLNFGPITWSVRDAALLMSVWSGPDARDALSLPETGEDWFGALGGAVKGAKVAYSPDLGWAVDPEVRANVENGVRTLGDIGCKVEEVQLNLTEDVYEAELVKWASLSTALFERYATPELRPKMTRQVLDFFKVGNERSAADYIRMDIARSRWYNQVQSVLDRYDYIVCPTIAVPVPPVDHMSAGPDVVAGKHVDTWLGWVLTWPFNLSMHPTANVPVGFTAGDLPVGMQIVGRRFRETDVLRLAARFEEAAPWGHRRPAIVG